MDGKKRDIRARMRAARVHVLLFLAAAGVCIGQSALAQTYPQRPVRMVVPLSPGGGVDLLARIVGEQLGAAWGQRFVVDNRPGAGGSIGIEIVAKAPPDGHTLLVSSSSLVTNAAIQSVRYDPIRDFQPVTKFTTNPYFLLTSASLAVASVQDLVSLAKSRPDRVTYGSAGTGGILHLAAELLCAMTGTRMTHVPFKGVSEAYPAVVSGQVNWVLGSPISAFPLMRAGRLRALAVTAAQRNKAAPEVPTVAESGVPGYEASVWFGLLAPARVPAEIVTKLHGAASGVVRAADLARRMEAEGTGVVGNTPAEFSAELKAEFEKWRSLVQKAGLKI